MRAVGLKPFELGFGEYNVIITRYCWYYDLRGAGARRIEYYYSWVGCFFFKKAKREQIETKKTHHQVHLYKN